MSSPHSIYAQIIWYICFFCIIGALNRVNWLKNASVCLFFILINKKRLEVILDALMYSITIKNLKILPKD
jgi:hypothetical protein